MDCHVPLDKKRKEPACAAPVREGADLCSAPLRAQMSTKSLLEDLELVFPKLCSPTKEACPRMELMAHVYPEPGKKIKVFVTSLTARAGPNWQAAARALFEKIQQGGITKRQALQLKATLLLSC